MTASTIARSLLTAFLVVFVSLSIYTVIALTPPNLVFELLVPLLVTLAYSAFLTTACGALALLPYSVYLLTPAGRSRRSRTPQAVLFAPAVLAAIAAGISAGMSLGGIDYWSIFWF